LEEKVPHHEVLDILALPVRVLTRRLKNEKNVERKITVGFDCIYVTPFTTSLYSHLNASCLNMNAIFSYREYLCLFELGVVVALANKAK